MSEWYWEELGKATGSEKVQLGIVSDDSNFTEVCCSFTLPWNLLPIEFPIKKSAVTEYYKELATYQNALGEYYMQEAEYEAKMEAYPQALADYEAELAAWQALDPPRPTKPIPPEEPVKPVFTEVEPEQHFGRFCYNIQTHICYWFVNVAKELNNYKIYLDKCKFDDTDYTDEVTINYRTKVVPTDLIIKKIDRKSKQLLAGATFDLVGTHNGESIEFNAHNIEDADATISDDHKTITFTTTNAEIHLTDLLPGCYMLIETTTPSGYITKEFIEFCIDGDGKVALPDDTTCTTSVVNKVSVITVPDAQPTDLIIAKISAGTKAQLSGAGFELSGRYKDSPIVFTSDNIEGTSATLADSNKKIQFTTTTEPIHLSKFGPGRYKLVETEVPLGYESHPFITFYVDDNAVVELPDPEAQGSYMSKTASDVPILTVENQAGPAPE